MLRAKPVRGFDSIFRGNSDNFVDFAAHPPLSIADDGRDEPVADPEYPVRPGRPPAHHSGFARLDRNESHSRIREAKRSSNSHQRPARADACDECDRLRVAMRNLPNDLLPRCSEVALDVQRIGELVGVERALFARNAISNLDCFRETALFRTENEVRSEFSDEVFALFRHVFRHDDVHTIAFLLSIVSEGDASVAARRFDDRHSRRKNAEPFALLDDELRDSVLDASTGIDALQLGEYAFDSRDGSVADEVHLSARYHPAFGGGMTEVIWQKNALCRQGCRVLGPTCAVRDPKRGIKNGGCVGMQRCSKCDAILSGDAKVCQLCFAPTTSGPALPERLPAAPGMPVTEPAVACGRPYSWIHGIVAVLAFLWILDGGLLLWAGIASEAAMKQFGLGGIGAIPTIAGSIYLLCGIGLILGQEWAFGTVKAVCWMRALLSLFWLWFAINVSPAAAVYPAFGIAFAGFQIWVLSRAEQT